MPHLMIMFFAINEFITPFLDNEMSIFEEYGALNKEDNVAWLMDCEIHVNVKYE